MKHLLFVSLIFISATALCQSSLAGKVVSEKGEPLPNASVFLPNSTIGVYTNDKGEFILNHLPSGNISFAVSYVGYEVITVPVTAASLKKHYIIKMQPLNNELEAVVIGKYDKGGWKKWGNTFAGAFLGTSLYARNCTITNKDVIKFIYSDAIKQLNAFANEPLLIENTDLGYRITVNLVDFSYNTSTQIVDYQTYSFFKEMQGSDTETGEWKKNRLKVYALSLLRFMRSLYERNLENEGYKIRIIERKINTEKQRIQSLYKETFNRITGSLNTNKSNQYDLNNLVEQSFSRDSLKYYKKVLSQTDGSEKRQKILTGFNDLVKQKDSVTMVLDFKDYMQVTYTRSKEPEEYSAYKKEMLQSTSSLDFFNQNAARDFPVTELSLQQGLPIEISANGYFSNVDLYMNGFWGWWEKIATKLPYEYEP